MQFKMIDGEKSVALTVPETKTLEKAFAICEQAGYLLRCDPANPFAIAAGEIETILTTVDPPEDDEPEVTDEPS